MARVTLTNNMADARVNSRSDGKCNKILYILLLSLTLYGVDCAYQQNGGHSRQFASARVNIYKKIVTEISRSKTPGRIYNL